MKKGKILTIGVIIVFIILISLIGNFVVAETEIVDKGIHVPLFTRLKHIFNLQEFSVVGDTRACENNPSRTWWNPPSNVPFERLASDDCSLSDVGRSGLYDVWVGNYEEVVKEYKDSVGISCSRGCTVELYCCPKECSSKSDCSQYGALSECKTINCRNWYKDGIIIGYQCPTPEGVWETGMPYSLSYYRYCTQGYVRCWYYNSEQSACVSHDYYGDTVCPSTYEQLKLYPSKSGCETNIPPPNGNGGVGDIRIKDIEADKVTYMNDEATFFITLQNYGTKQETINVEAGFYSADYAHNVAQLFSTVVQTPNCNPAEEFVKTKQVTLSPGESDTIQIKVIPYFAFQTYKIGKWNLKTDPLVTFVGLYKQCLGGYTNEAGTKGLWSEGKTGMYYYQDYIPYCSFRILWIGGVDIYCGFEKIGYCSGDNLYINKKCSIPLTINVLNGTDPNVKIESTTLADSKKIALTKEQISKSTSADLLAASCLGDQECLLSFEDEGYSVDCIPIKTLRTEGILTLDDKNKFFDNAKTITKGTVYGATAGVVGCAVLVAAFQIPVLAPVFCGWAMGLLGGSVTSIILDIKEDDPLLKELEAKNDLAVGICVKEKEEEEEEGEGFCFESVNKWMKPITKSDNCQTNTIAFIFIAFFGVLIVMRLIEKF